jgi:hypothetical protein
MKKLLSLLGAIGLVATSSATVVSCDNGDKDSSNAGDFTTDLSKVAGDKTDALVEVIKTQFKNTDGIADAQVMIFDTIDNANKAEDVMTGAADPTDLPTEVDKITGEEASLAFFAFAIDKDTSAYSATVLKGTITNKPEEKTGITLDKNEVLVAADTADTVTISNFANLTNVKAESADVETATAELAEGTITITGVKEGTTTINVTADGVDPVTIKVTVKAADEKTTISLDKNEVSIAADTADTVTISNFANLTNVKAESADVKTATAELAEGTITITGVKEGITTINVTADGVDPVTIKVTVTAAK